MFCFMRFLCYREHSRASLSAQLYNVSMSNLIWQLCFLCCLHLSIINTLRNNIAQTETVTAWRRFQTPSSLIYLKEGTMTRMMMEETIVMSINSQKKRRSTTRATCFHSSTTSVSASSASLRMTSTLRQRWISSSAVAEASLLMFADMSSSTVELRSDTLRSLNSRFALLPVSSFDDEFIVLFITRFLAFLSLILLIHVDALEVSDSISRNNLVCRTRISVEFSFVRAFRKQSCGRHGNVTQPHRTILARCPRIRWRTHPGMRCWLGEQWCSLSTTTVRITETLATAIDTVR